jgi:DNA repair photolyase
MLLHKKKQIKMNYTSPRWSGEITDCAMPMTFDQYDHCSYNCLYCFSWFQKALKSFNPLFPNEMGKNYQSLPLRSVKPENLKKLFSGQFTTGQRGQFTEYIKQRITMQWGGLCDPFDRYEYKHKIGLEVLKTLKKIHYPICFSTKATWWTEDDRYMSLFKGEDNWNTKFSIINLDPNLAKLIEKGVPSPADRLKAMKRIAKINPIGGVTLRLRPFIVGMSDVNEEYLDLIKLAKEHGATAVSTEFFCLEDRAHAGTIPRYQAISKAIGFDVRHYYKINSPGMCGYLRLNWKLKEPYFKKMRDLCEKLNMRFYVSDAHWKDMCDDGCCCGLPDHFNYSKAQYTELLQIGKSRKDGKVYWSDMGKQIDMFKSFRYIYAEGFNTVGSRRRTTRWTMTMYDYLLEIWNDPNSAKSPYKYFAGLFKPVERDIDGNTVYVYKPYNCRK